MKRIQEALNEKILILDGPMGTMIQNENLKEEDFRGKKFESSSISLKGNNDILNLTQEKIIQAFGRVGRNKISNEYTIRLRDNNIISKIFYEEIDKIEVINMQKIFC